MFGNRYHISIRLAQDSVRGSALHALTLAVFLMGMVGQGFSPCPRHVRLHGSEYASPAVPAGAILGGKRQANTTPDDSGSQHDEAFCSCSNACDLNSGDSFSPSPSHTHPLTFTVLTVVERLETSLLDTRQSAYLAPLPQPPPDNS